MKPKRGLHAVWGTPPLPLHRPRPFKGTVRLFSVAVPRVWWPGLSPIAREFRMVTALRAPLPGVLRPRPQLSFKGKAARRLSARGAS